MEFFFILWLLGIFSGGDTGPKCPPLVLETQSVYAAPGPSVITFNDLKQSKMFKGKDGNNYYWINLSDATITVDMITGKVLGKKIGEEPIPGAAEHNKRVRECQTYSGEFK